MSLAEGNSCILGIIQNSQEAIWPFCIGQLGKLLLDKEPLMLRKYSSWIPLTQFGVGLLVSQAVADGCRDYGILDFTLKGGTGIFPVP